MTAIFEWFNNFAISISQSLVDGNLPVLGLLFLIATVIEFGIQVPFVQDTVLIVIGYQPLDRLLIIAPVAILSLFIGRMAGASIVYQASTSHGQRIISWLSDRSPKTMARINGFHFIPAKNIWMAVALARLTPGLLLPTSVVSGVSRVKYLNFVLGIVVSTLITDVSEVIYGQSVKMGLNVMGITPSPLLMVGTLALFLAAAWLFNWLWRAKHARL